MLKTCTRSICNISDTWLCHTRCSLSWVEKVWDEINQLASRILLYKYSFVIELTRSSLPHFLKRDGFDLEHRPLHLQSVEEHCEARARSTVRIYQQPLQSFEVVHTQGLCQWLCTLLANTCWQVYLSTELISSLLDLYTALSLIGNTSYFISEWMSKVR